MGTLPQNVSQFEVILSCIAHSIYVQRQVQRRISERFADVL